MKSETLKMKAKIFNGIFMKNYIKHFIGGRMDIHRDKINSDASLVELISTAMWEA